MLSAAAGVERGRRPWDGDLRHIAVQVWSEASDVAAVVVADDGAARVWLNARHVCGSHGWLVWMWARKRARHQPFAVLYAHELPAWMPPDSAGAVRAN